MFCQPANLSAAANPSSFNQAQSTVVTATVARAGGQPYPTGLVGFYGQNAAIPACSGTLVNGSVSCTLDGLSFDTGNVAVMVSYPGDATYAPAQVAVPVTVAFSSAVTLSGTSVSVAPGASAGNISSITVAPYNFLGTVHLSCVLASSPSGAQLLPSCSIPPSVTIAAASSITTAMTISSTAPSASTAGYPASFGRSWPGAGTGALALGMFLLFVMVLRRRPYFHAGLVLIIALLGALAACGGGSPGGGGGGGGGGSPNPGTTSGRYTFVVSGSFTATNGPTQAQTTVTVTVQ